MRIGHGCHLRTPRRVGAALIMGAIILLPGAAWLKAQESVGESNSPAGRLPLAPPSFTNSDTPNRRTSQSADATAGNSGTPIPMGIAASSEATGDLLQVSLLVLEIPTELVQEIRNVAAPVHAAKTDGRVLRLDADGNVMMVGTFDIGSLVRSDLGIAGHLVVQDTSLVVPASTSQPLPKLMPAVAGTPWRLNDAAHQRVEEWCKNATDKNIRILSRPKIATHSGIPASVEVGQEQRFIIGFDSKDGQPKFKNKMIGLSCDITATLSEHDSNKADFSVPANAEWVQLKCNLRNSEVDRVNEVTFNLKDGGSFRQPSINSQFVEFMLNVPLGATYASDLGPKKSDNGQFTTLFFVTVDRIGPAQTAQQADMQRNASSGKVFESTGAMTTSSAETKTLRNSDYYTRVPIVGPVKEIEDK